MPGTPELSPLEQQILKAKLKVREEMPDVADAPIEKMGWFDQLVADARGKMQGGTTLALAHPGKVGSVAYNPEGLKGQGPSEIEDTLAHELVHVRQGREAHKGKSLFDQVRAYLSSFGQGQLPYGQMPDELEAFQYEGDRAVREGRHPGITPNFSSPGYREKGDIILPREKK